MITYWLICAIFVAIALAFVLPPLLQGFSKKSDEGSRRQSNIAVYRDQIGELEADLRNGIISREQYEQDRDELERRMLEDVSITEPVIELAKPVTGGRGAVYAVALGIPLLAIALYFRVGNPNAISATPAVRAQATTPVTPTGEVSQQQIEANVAKLAKRLEESPNDVQGWTMLARSYAMLEKYGEASAAYAKATALKGDNADLWADYAFALAMAKGQKLLGQPVELIDKALKLDPENAKALELAGSAAFEAKDYKQAVNYWQKLLKKVPANSEVAQSLNDRIKEAETLANAVQK
jgi:cytochrome c-type biogenesis protein CcmH